MAIDPRVAKIFAEELERAGASPLLQEAAYEATLVEAGGQNVRHGDRDSLGVLQQRPSQGWGTRAQVMNPRYAIRQFIKRGQALQRRGFKGSSGQLAQAVQRSAFPDRYEQRDAEAEQIINRYLGGRARASMGEPSLGSPGTLKPGTPPTYQQSETKTDTRAALVDALRSKKPGESLLGKTRHLVGTGAYTTSTPGQWVEGNPTTFTPGEAPSPGTGDDGSVDAIKREADLIDRARVPYKWGGGHGAKQLHGSKVTPMDCSGAVSRLLGINPRVSGELAKWGRPGRGKRVTVWANAEHVLIEIDGRFWGTSKDNPGGGAGWIERSKVSKAYLSRFTPRHPAGQ